MTTEQELASLGMRFMGAGFQYLKMGITSIVNPLARQHYIKALKHWNEFLRLVVPVKMRNNKSFVEEFNKNYINPDSDTISHAEISFLLSKIKPEYLPTLEDAIRRMSNGELLLVTTFKESELDYVKNIQCKVNEIMSLLSESSQKQALETIRKYKELEDLNKVA